MDDTSQLDPNLIRQVLALQSNADDPQAIQLARQQAMANQLRGNSMKPLEGQMAGRVYVAPNPLQAVGQLAQGYVGQRMQGGIDQGMQALAQTRQTTKGAYLDALTAALRRGSVAHTGASVPGTPGSLPDSGAMPMSPNGWTSAGPTPQVSTS
jgi:hypothetical protein